MIEMLDSRADQFWKLTLFSRSPFALPFSVSHATRRRLIIDQETGGFVLPSRPRPPGILDIACTQIDARLPEGRACSCHQCPG